MSYDDIECPCCGDVAASGLVYDGDALACGCAGHVVVDEDGAAYADADDCERGR